MYTLKSSFVSKTFDRVSDPNATDKNKVLIVLLNKYQKCAYIHFHGYIVYISSLKYCSG